MKSFNQYLAGKMGGAAINEMDGAGAVSTQDMEATAKIRNHTLILLKDLNSLSPATFRNAYTQIIEALNKLAAERGVSGTATAARQARAGINQLISGKGLQSQNDPNLPQ